MKDTRLILNIGASQFLMPEDVDFGATVKSLQGFQSVQSIGYGSEPSYKITGAARVGIEIVPTDAIRLASTLTEPPPMAMPLSDDDEPL